MSPNSLFHLQFPAPSFPERTGIDTLLDSLDNYSKSVWGIGTYACDGAAISLQSNGGAGAGAILMKSLTYPLTPMTWAKKKRIKSSVRIALTADANAQDYFFVGSYSDSGYGFGFRFVPTKIRGYSVNGGTRSFIDLLTGLPNNLLDTYLLEAIFYPGSRIEFYIDGVLKATKTTYLPTGTVSAEVLFGLMTYTSLAVYHTIQFSFMQAEQEL